MLGRSGVLCRLESIEFEFEVRRFKLGSFIVECADEFLMVSKDTQDKDIKDTLNFHVCNQSYKRRHDPRCGMRVWDMPSTMWYCTGNHITIAIITDEFDPQQPVLT